MALNISNTRQLLQSFNFQELFREELGWQNPTNKKAFPFQTKEGIFHRKAIAELSGAIVFEITNDEGSIPDYKTRELISKEIQKLSYEHILIFVDKERTQSIWRWLKKQDKKSLGREHYFSVGQPGDLFISKLSGLLVDISEIENDITITDVAKKIQNALDIERVTKKFYRDYQQQFTVFLDLIEGIDNEADKRWYASVILNRLMFIFFLQKKRFINNGDDDYLYERLLLTKKQFGKNKYYSEFLKKLFFEGFAKPEADRSAETNKLLGKIKYLNGGLFLKHKIEEKYSNIRIPDVAFENLLKSDDPKGLFEQFSWSLDDTPGGKDDEINPDVLGYIFEKYINQKAFGAYYTRTEITEYLCEQTIYKLILDAVNEPAIDPELLKKAGLDKGAKPKHYDTVAELLLNLDAATCRKLIYGDNAVLPNLSLLDPACGSGAFLVAAMKTLINVYSSIVGKIDFLGDSKLIQWKKEIEKDHPSINYYIKKKIITNNLYGVDIMEEATEIAKLRLFLALVSSAQTVDQLEPLPNIDFNIMSGNSLIGMMRVDPNQFNKLMPKATKNAAGKTIKGANLFNPGVAQTNMFGEEHAKGYQQLINEKEAAISAYKNAQNLGLDELQTLRNDIQKQEQEANKILNQLLVEDFNNLNIRFSVLKWDDKKNKETVDEKRAVTIDDINKLEPFHWGYEFSEIFRKKNGFDAIIANPPWEIFKPTAKEFFKDYTDLPIQRKMRIEDFNEHKDELLQDKAIRKDWLQYLSKFPYQSEYYRKSTNYKNQTAIINGKKSGSDINLYKLFLEQSYNLLRDGGRCGIVVPSGIYLDSGNMQLRKLLFENCKVENLYGISNEKFLFEEVEHNIKYALLSFLKNDVTSHLNVCFRINPREAIGAKDLDTFFHDYSKDVKLTYNEVKQLSPISLAVPEVKSEAELTLFLKISKYPILGDEKLKFGNEFHMTNDSGIFNDKKNSKDYFPLVEGKMIHQFTYMLAPPRYWVSAEKGRNALMGRNKDVKQILTYQKYRLAFRAIARGTDSRTMIATILPPNTFTSNSLAIVASDINAKDQLLFVAIFNSMTFDFILRSRISSNLNFFYIYNIPIPLYSEKSSIVKQLIDRATKLICTREEYESLWQDVTGSKWSSETAKDNYEKHDKLKAELDAIVAHFYKLSEEEFEIVLNTFPVVATTHKQASLEYFKKIASKFAADGSVVDYQSLIAKGESPKLEFKSTLRVDVKTGKPERFIEHSVLKTLGAFLNSDGGTLLIGVEDNKNILGLDLDFNSFSKPDKLDEFQKHFDNLIHKSFGNRFQRYLDVSFPEVNGKTICAVTIKEKSTEAVYLVDEGGNEKFYIRRQASTVDLKPSETVKYIKEHWQ